MTKKGGMFNWGKGIDYFHAPSPSTQSIYQLQASSYPDIKAGNCPCWHPTKTAYLEASIIPDPFPDPRSLASCLMQLQLLFLPLDLAPGIFPWYQTPLQTDTQSQAVSWSLFHLSEEEEAVWPLKSVYICPAKYHNRWGWWIGSSSKDKAVSEFEIFQEGRLVRRGWGTAAKLTNAFLTPRLHANLNFHCKSSIHRAPPLVKLSALAN